MTPPNNGIAVRSADGQCAGMFLPPPAATRLPLLACIPGGGCSGKYFNVASPSTASLASARGFPVLLIDRPGYGKSPAIDDPRPIRASLPSIRALLVQALCVADARDVVLIGHSIGGAVALNLTVEPRDLPIRAVAVSGIGDEPPRATRAWVGALSAAPARPDFSADLFFGNPDTYTWRGPAALRRAAEPWRMSEVVEIVSRWPHEWRDIAGMVPVPVHFRLSEQDGIWESGDAVVARMADGFSRSPRVDAALLTGGGHAYEFHIRAFELINEQLDFLEEYGGWHAD